jgi:hypothetical protein
MTVPGLGANTRSDHPTGRSLINFGAADSHELILR